jgi:hypothetical protein
MLDDRRHSLQGHRGFPFFRFLLLSALALQFQAGRLSAQPRAPTPEQVKALRANRLHSDAVNSAPAALSVEITSRAESRAFYNSIYLASENVPSGWTGTLSGTPGTSATGTAGTTSAAFQSAVQLRINWYRAMAGVPGWIAFDPVNYGAPDQDAALMMAANNALDHDPPQGWLLYTSDGANAAGNSNLALGNDGPDAIDGYIADPGSSNTEVGHRRWLLYPQTQTMGTGDVDAVNGFPAANATWVFDGNFGKTRPAVRDNFVAWPPPGYVPYQVVFPRWSFAYPNADFSAATVTMTSGGTPVPVSLEAFETGYGEDTLVWDYDGLDGNTVDTPAPDPGSDTSYNVQVNNVMINGAAQNFSYTVTVFDPAVAGSGDNPPTVTGPSNPAVNVQANFVVNGLASFESGFEFRSVGSLSPALTVFGAEGGLQGVIPSISDLPGTSTEAYNPVDTTTAFSGSASYHLAQPDPMAQTLTLPGYYLVSGASASLQFESLLGFATSHQTAHVQISTDDGVIWTDLFAQSGIDTPNTPVETSFQAESLPLGAYAGLPFQIRFAYTYDQSGESVYAETSTGVGWNIDAIAFTGVDDATPGTPSPFISGSLLPFTPQAAGAFGLQARAVLFGLYPDAWGPVTTATAVASTGSLPSFTTQPTGQTVSRGSTLVLTGIASAGSTYQWLFNGVAVSDSSGPSDIVSGANGPQLEIADTTGASAGTYTLLATNANGSTLSSPAALTVVTSTNPGVLSSISARAYVGTGANVLIGGFYIVGSTSATVLVQAIGPALAGLGVSGTLQHPALSIHQTQNGKDAVLYSNSGWGSGSILLQAAATAYANPVLQPGSTDSELLLTLPPGGYTAEVGSADGTSTGVALCAIYQLP